MPDELDQIRRLAGINEFKGFQPYSIDNLQGSNISVTGNEKAELMRQHDIRPGTPEWFRLWFARPFMTGESPFKNNK
jgi:hypothetical protein